MVCHYPTSHCPHLTGILSNLQARNLEARLNEKLAGAGRSVSSGDRFLVSARKGKYADASLYQPGQADQINQNTPDVDTKRILQAEAVGYDGENISFRDVTQDVLAQEKMERGAKVGENVAEVAGELEDGNQAQVSMYSHIPDSPFVGPGKLFTKKQKNAILEENLRRNNGVYRSDLSGIELAKPVKSRKGVVPDPNEAQVDHIKARNRGGSNSYKNAQVLSRRENREKWDR